jgi:ATP-dependent Clp protease adapter protein ClpS
MKYCVYSVNNPSIEASDLVDIIVMNDDVHTFDDVSKALKDLPIPEQNKLIQAIHDSGHQVVLTALASSADDMLNHLRSKGILVAGLPRADWQTQSVIVQEATIWLTKLAATSDAMCRIITNSFHLELLEKLCAADNYLPKAFIQPLHNLFLGKLNLRHA